MNRAALSPSSLWSMARESASSWVDDFAPSMGAAIAYYTMFSIAPMLLIIIAIAGFFFGREAASEQLYAQIAGLVGDDGARAIQGLVDSASDPKDGMIATIISVVVLLIGATTVFAELQTDLDRIWKAPAAKKDEGIWAMIRGRLLSLGLVVSMGFVMLVSLVISAALSALGSWWGGLFGELEWLLHLVNLLVSFAVITVMFALMYKILPRVSIGWHDVWIGAAVTALLFTIGKFLVGLYLGKASVASGFGAAGSFAVILVWVYYSAQIFLLGAEFTWVFAHRYGTRQGQDKPATAKEQGSTAKPATEGASASQPSTTPSAAGQPTAGPRPGPRPAVPSPAGPRSTVPAYASTAPAPLRRAPARRQPTGLVQRHPGVIAAAALLLGALASEALRFGRTHSRPRALRALAKDVSRLRTMTRRPASRALRWLRA
ncbi:MAG TPA: YhjD/YihY/BrkB family envelope integrity protein [Casimicrobiaceae bacterium]|nr:YhjD/YihY/BrkB family envelope integrity protein [Casimicrobiaceae bacterium]